MTERDSLDIYDFLLRLIDALNVIRKTQGKRELRLTDEPAEDLKRDSSAAPTFMPYLTGQKPREN